MVNSKKVLVVFGIQRISFFLIIEFFSFINLFRSSAEIGHFLLVKEINSDTIWQACDDNISTLLDIQFFIIDDSLEKF
jgi:hypothetical protein